MTADIINPATGQITSNYIKDDTNEESTGFSVFSSWWKGRIDTMAAMSSMAPAFSGQVMGS